jgi:hypothetical protein
VGLYGIAVLVFVAGMRVLVAVRVVIETVGVFGGVTVTTGVGVGAQAVNSTAAIMIVQISLVFICHLHRTGRGVNEQPPPGQVISV